MSDDEAFKADVQDRAQRWLDNYRADHIADDFRIISDLLAEVIRLRAPLPEGGGDGKEDGFASPREAPSDKQSTASRNARQQIVAEWCAISFGVGAATSLPQRSVRLLEEVIEAYQAAGGDPTMAHKLVDFVFSRPVGELGKEIGAVGLVLLSLANAAGVSADAEEAREVARVLAKPPSHWAARDANKKRQASTLRHVSPIREAKRTPLLPPPPRRADMKPKKESMVGWVLYDETGHVSTFKCFETREIAKDDAWIGERPVRARVTFTPLSPPSPKGRKKNRRKM